MNNENAISEQQIADWKSQWGRVFESTIVDDTYVWRQLRRKEYVSIMSDKPGEDEGSLLYERQENIAKTAILFPDNIADLIEANAGLATTLSDEIILKSGFDLSETKEL
jgi:hypothetical protein